jgi:choline dehydrogenase-like flavoprotein
MTRDPADGVVDPDLTVHGVHNLSVVGGAVFPTSSQANPTLTILALSLRLADRLQADLRRAA